MAPFGKHLADSTGRGDLAVGERAFGKPCNCGVFGTFAKGSESLVQRVGAVISGIASRPVARQFALAPGARNPDCRAALRTSTHRTTEYGHEGPIPVGSR